MSRLESFAGNKVGTPVYTTVFYYGCDGEEVTKDNILGDIRGTVLRKALNPTGVVVKITSFRQNFVGAPCITDPQEITEILKSVSIRGADFNAADMTYADHYYNWEKLPCT